MKKFKYFSLACILLFVAMILTACNNTSLISPSNLEVDIDNKLTWDKVSDARSYVVEVTGEGNDFSQEYTSRKAYLSLSKLAEGDYVIRIKSVGDTEGKVVSEWSEPLSFHRDYESGCTYKLINNNTEYQITNGRGTSGDVIIDSIYRGKPVVSIADSAFKGNTSITSITLGDSIRTIGKNAFYNCINIKTIKLPKNLESIGEAAFQSCKSLISLTIPEKITNIEKNTFNYCSTLTSVTFSNNLKKLSENSFRNCYELTEVNIPDSVESIGKSAFGSDNSLKTVNFGKGLITIEDEAFYRCTNLTNINFNKDNNVTSIGARAFSDSQALKNVTIPEGVKTIGEGAFQSCINLESISLPDSLYKLGIYAIYGTKIYNDQINVEGTEFIYADNWLADYVSNKSKDKYDAKDFKEGLVGVADYTFIKEIELANVTLPTTVKVIGECAFYGCTQLWRFFSTGVEYIWNEAFSGCSVLSNVSFGNSLKRIGNYTFYNCEAISSIKLPTTLEKIGTRAFENTGIWNNESENLTNGGLVYAGNWVVGVVSGSSSFTIKDGTVGISDYVFYQHEYVSQVIGLNKVRYIGYGAFYGATSLALINLNNNLKVIEPYAFYKCTSVTEVTLPLNLVSIGTKAFYKCGSLIDIDFSKSLNLESIGEYAFYGCTSLENAKFSSDSESSLTIIGNNAFYKCSALKSIKLPDTLTTLGDKAFYKCTALEKLIIGAGLKEIPNYAFSYTAIKELEIPSNIERINKYAFYKCENVETLKLNNGLNYVGPYAFYGMTMVKELNLPNTITTISNFAFKGFSSLKTVVLSDKIETIIQHAFYGCSNATFYTNVTELPENWNKMFNSSYRPIIYNCELSTDGSYVVGLEVKEGTFSLVNENTVLEDPLRDGYTFGGWEATVVVDGETKTVIYQTSEIPALENGTKLVAIWNALN